MIKAGPAAYLEIAQPFVKDELFFRVWQNGVIIENGFIKEPDLIKLRDLIDATLPPRWRAGFHAV